MAKEKKLKGDLNTVDVQKDNKELYGMGSGLFGDEEWEKSDERWKKDKETGVGLTDKPEMNAGAVGDISALLKKRSRASDAPQAVVPYRQRDEALLSIIHAYGDDLSEASEEIKDLCASLLVDVEDKNRFEALRGYLESAGIDGIPEWNDIRIEESYMSGSGSFGSGTQWSIYPWDRSGPFVPGGNSQKREVPGIIEFAIPLPSNKAPDIKIPDPAKARINSQNARKGAHSRLARARDQITQVGRNNTGRENRAHYLGAGDVRPHDEKATMKRATGKYENMSDSKIQMKEGIPTVNGMPWYHGKVSKKIIGGVPVIEVAEGHILCSGSLPRPKLTEGKYVWDTGCPFSDYDMHVAFAQLSEGMQSERNWLKKSGKDFVLGIPTEGVIIECRNGELSFLTFDSKSGREAAQEWMVERSQEVGSRQAMLETVTYGYVRTGQSDMVLDRVIRKLNRLNMLDILEDAVFDKNAEALYVLLNPTLEESDVQAVAQGIQADYPEVQILGGPLDENVDWWVLYIPKPGSDYGPELGSIFAPQIAKPLDIPSRGIIDQAISQVVNL